MARFLPVTKFGLPYDLSWALVRGESVRQSTRGGGDALQIDVAARGERKAGQSLHPTRVAQRGKPCEISRWLHGASRLTSASRVVCVVPQVSRAGWSAWLGDGTMAA
jgi:hypothetical protein